MGTQQRPTMATTTAATTTPFQSGTASPNAKRFWPITPPASAFAQQQQLHPPAASTIETEYLDAPPVIDMQGLTEHQLVERVRAACQRWGFFQIVGHGVDPAIRDRFEHTMRQFFALPTDQKLLCERSASNARGYVAREMTKQKLDHKECFDVGNPRDWNSADDDQINQGLNGVNRFPQADVLPGFRDTVQLYFAEMEQLSEKVSQIMALGMGASRDFFQKAMTSRHTSHLRLNHYPELAAAAESDALGVGPHTDSGFLTVLAQDEEVHTLQVKDRLTEQWVPVTPVPGAFTINTGDLCVIFSNGLYHAPEHRVLTHTKERYSAPYFYAPAYETEIGPLDNLITPDRPSQFWPMQWGYFRAMRAMNNFGAGAYVKVDHWRVTDDGSKPEHVERQEQFSAVADYNVPFDIEVYQQKLHEMSQQ